MLLISFQTLAAQNLLAVEMSSVERTSKQKSVQEVTLKDHLFWIEDEMSVFFNYDDDLLGDISFEKNRLRTQLKKNELENYLARLLAPHKLAFEKLDGDIYIIKPKKEIENKKAVDQKNLAKQIAPPSVPKNISHSSVQSAQIQTRTITGTVTDEAGEGLSWGYCLRQRNFTRSCYRYRRQLSCGNRGRVILSLFALTSVLFSKRLRLESDQ